MMSATEHIDIEINNARAVPEKIEKFNTYVDRFSGFETFRMFPVGEFIDIAPTVEDDYRGKFADDLGFAFLVSHTLSSGRVVLKIASDDVDNSTWGYWITHGKVSVMSKVWKIGERIKEPKDYKSKVEKAHPPKVEIYRKGSHQFAVMAGEVFKWDGWTWVRIGYPSLEEVQTYEKDRD